MYAVAVYLNTGRNMFNCSETVKVCLRMINIWVTIIQAKQFKLLLNIFVIIVAMDFKRLPELHRLHFTDNLSIVEHRNTTNWGGLVI